MERARDELGLEPVPIGELITVDCDVLAPCALGAVLNASTIPELRCRIVAGAANNQLADEDRDGRELFERGILYAPDFMINAGGLINVYNELGGRYNRERAVRMTRTIYLNLMRAFEVSKAESIPTNEAADRVAEERIATIERLGSRHWGRFISPVAPDAAR